jgi:Domain of unknown function (DUF4145)
MRDFPWTCPYCNRMVTITENNVSGESHSFDLANKDGRQWLDTFVIVCPNSECREYAISAELYKSKSDSVGNLSKARPPSVQWQLKPQSTAKPFPDYIPKPVLDDYREACLIASDSPKASATLSRRCLQGIIRDYWGISKGRLIDEIKELEGKIDQTTWLAIDAVRSVGNIGAHMEKDINLIVDVDPQEAVLLIGLIEVLLKEWYVGRHDRQEHMQKVIDLAKGKQLVKIP